jgi:septal ring factor EnvC (AmiA/AmiB activator)
MRSLLLLAAAAFLAVPAHAQDVRGLEVCTAEKQMERRTGCLQANIEFLQQRLNKTALEARQKQAASERELNAAKTQLATAAREIAALKDALAKVQEQIGALQRAKDGKK